MGLQSLSGLIQKGGLIDQSGLTWGNAGLQSLNPLSLNPYLLFDARDSMIGTLENPTLDLDPSKPDTLNVITATRAGTATYTDADGVIQSASPDTVRVDHVQGEELTPTKYQHIPYTDFSTGWTLIDATKEAANTPSPSPSYNAIRVTAQNNIYGRLQDYIGVSQDVTISVYVKRDGVDTLFQISSQTYGASRFNINESGVSIESNGGLGYDIQEHGDGWWRVSASFAGVGYVQFRPDQELGTRSVLLAMPQVEEGTTASDFVPNTTGSPKFITGATFGPRVPMMLIEPSATNLVEYSEDFSNSYWNTASASVAVDYGYLSPRGDLTASKVTKQTANGHLFADGVAGAKSIYIKGTAGETVNALDRYTDANTSITLTGEWQRVELDGVRVIFYAVDFRGGTATEVYIWGAQVETGSVATSYIPTSGSTVTRAADDLVIDGSAFSDFYNQSEGTIYVEYEPKVVNSTSNTLFEFSNGTTAERILSLVEPFYNLYLATSSVVEAQFGGGSPQADTLNRLAASFKPNNARLSLNGGTQVVDTSLSMPSLNQLNIGQRYNSVQQLNGHIKRLIYWPTHSDSL